MLLGFKRQFAPYVKDGSKTHTIRAPRAIPPKVGETCHCYVDPRQKTMALLGRWPCVKVESITISQFFNSAIPLAVSIEGHLLTTDETESFLWRDGFRKPSKHIPANPLSQYPAIQQAAEFWKSRLSAGAWNGIVIHWKYT